MGIPVTNDLTDSEIERFWSSQLPRLNAAKAFPQPSTVDDQVADRRSLSSSFKLQKWLSTDPAIVFHAAWGLLAAQYTECTEIAFARVVRYGTTVPTCFQIDWKKSVGQALEDVITTVAESQPFEKLELEKIELLEGGAELKLGTLLNVNTQEHDRSELNYERFPLIFTCNVLQDGIIDIVADYDATVIETRQMSRLITQLEHIIQQLVKVNPTTSIEDACSCNEEDYQEIMALNHVALQNKSIDECLHWHFEAQVAAQPDAEAICSWDRNFTYRELDIASARLATQLANYYQVRPEVIVPICFSKSSYAIVAMLAILRAGGAYTAIDPSHPPNRIREIVGKTGATTVIMAPEHAHMFKGIVKQTVVLSESFLNDLPGEELSILSPANSNNMAIIQFTSGSTGNPKGIVLEHGGLCKAFREHGMVTGFRKGLRVLQLASYTFDVSNSEIMETLFHGGVVCVPSDDERMNNLTEAASRLKVEWSWMTPSLAGLLNPTEIPSLQILGLGGEAVPRDVVDRWTDHVRQLYITYGPAECSIYTSLSNFPPHTDMIGTPYGCSVWIVNPTNHNILTPFGCIGELIIEGPIVGREYLAEEELSRKAFISSPPWLCDHQGNRRFYKTGDLARYDSNGQIRFVGRKDTQIKLRGQRIEMTEVEHHLSIALPECKQIVAGMIFPRELRSTPNLAAFIHISSEFEPDHSGIATDLPKTKEWQDKIQYVRDYLSQTLPPYMVPSIFIPFVKMPTNASWKTDRKRLNEIGAALTIEQLALLGGSRSGEYRAPSTPTEELLRALWATVLQVDETAISANDSFLRIGGNSLQAIHLVRLAREKGHSVTVKDIFMHPVLHDLADRMESTQNGIQDSEPIVPFSLLKSGVNKEIVGQKVAELANVNVSQIEDIFPCTPLQEGLISMTAKRAGDYVSRSVFCLSSIIDIERFKQACEKLVAMTPILRTRVVDIPGQGLVQAVIDESPQWDTLEGMNMDFEDTKIIMGLGTKLSTFGMMSNVKDSTTYFVWTIHHALYDGWSIPLILKNLQSIYLDEIIRTKTVPFQHFVKYIQTQNRQIAEQFWQKQFAEYESTIFPPLPKLHHVPRADSTSEHRITGLTWLKSGVTPATVVRTAWAILQASYTGSNDVLFGATMTGRNADIPGVERIAAPTIATIPVRVVLKSQQNLVETQQMVQKQTIEMIPYEQTGLQHIRRISQDACQFQTLLVVQPKGSTEQQEGFLFEQKNDGVVVNGFMNEVKTYSLMLDCQLEDDGVHIRVLYDEIVIKHKLVERILYQLEHILCQLCSDASKYMKVCEIETTSEQDLRTIWGWNARVPEQVDCCVHDLISSTAMDQPDALAVSAWNGELTYGQLDEMSKRLAHRLVGLGVGPDVIVPLCFEKSMWTPVAQLAVMKAGGASVMLDMSLPMDRLQSILRQVGDFPVVLSSAEHKDMASRMSKVNVIMVNNQSMGVLRYQEGCGRMSPALPYVTPSSLLYLVFTSGSTGTPKGVCISHSNVASASHHQRDFMRYDAPARVYDFSSYAFDISWSNFLYTLICGGCLCIPSDSDRKNDLSGSINKLKASIISITPSASRLLTPSSVPTLQTVNLVGEKEEEEDFVRWRESVYLKCGYGPSECTPISTGILANQDPDPIGLIGRGLGLSTWVVDTEGHRLVPPGVIGELWLEGPAVGPGYLNDEKKTAAAFISDPSWLLKGTVGFSGRRGRLYKTGDLVRYREDGTLAFIERKDTQVKIRGQRVELGDIEHHVQRILADKHPEAQIVAETIKISHKSDPTVVAFVTPAAAMSLTDNDIKATVAAMTESLDEQLSATLPTYMIPSAYIPIRSIPTTASSKTDRKRLREIGAALTKEDLANLHPSRSTDEFLKPTTVVEKRLRALWSLLFEIEASTISVNDNFLRIGGDSIQAMRLVNIAREQGITLAVADVLQYSRLSDMAQRAKVSNGDINTTTALYKDPEPFDLVSAKSDELQHLIKETIAPSLSFPVEQLQDLFPTTAIQASCADAAMRTPPQGCYFFHIDIPSKINLEKVTSFVHQIWKHLDILRTVFVMHEGKLMQVVPRDLPTPLTVYSLMEEEDLDDFQKPIFEECLKVPVRFGTTYIRFLVFHRPGHPTRLAFRVSHAHFDGVSLDTLLKCLASRLQDDEMPVVAQFAGYIRHVKENEEKTLSHWRKTLEGSAPMSLFPTGEKNRIISKSKTIATPKVPAGFTSANLYFAGCAQSLANIRHTTDVVMSMVVSARADLPAGLDGVFGPCLNMIPLRVKLDDNMDFAKTLSSMQEAQLNATRVELATIANIYQTCATDWPEHMRKLTYTIQFQNVGLPTVDLLGDGNQTSLGFFGSPSVWEHAEDIFIMAIPVQDNWFITISGNASHCTEEHLDLVLQTIVDTLLSA